MDEEGVDICGRCFGTVPDRGYDFGAIHAESVERSSGS